VCKKRISHAVKNSTEFCLLRFFAQPFQNDLQHQKSVPGVVPFSHHGHGFSFEPITSGIKHTTMRPCPQHRAVGFFDTAHSAQKRPCVNPCGCGPASYKCIGYATSTPSWSVSVQDCLRQIIKFTWCRCLCPGGQTRKLLTLFDPHFRSIRVHCSFSIPVDFSSGYRRVGWPNSSS